MDIPTTAQMTAMADQWGAFIREQVGDIQAFMMVNAQTPEAGQELAMKVFNSLMENVELEIPALTTFNMFLLFTLAMNAPVETLRIPA